MLKIKNIKMLDLLGSVKGNLYNTILSTFHIIVPKIASNFVRTVCRRATYRFKCNPLHVSPDHISRYLSFITTIFNSLITSNHVPTTFKRAKVTTILLKPTLDLLDIKNYWPVSLFSFDSNEADSSPSMCYRLHNQLILYLLESSLAFKWIIL